MPHTASAQALAASAAAPLPASRQLPIGPPSLPVTHDDVDAFIKDVNRVTEKARHLQDQLAATLGITGDEEVGNASGSGSGGQAVRERCSVSSLLDSANQFQRNVLVHTDVQDLLQQRWVPLQTRTAQTKRKGKKRKIQHVEKAEDEEGGEAKKVEQEEGRNAEDLEEVGEAEAALQEGEKTGLGLLRPPPEAHHFLRKTKVPDYNSLTTMRPAHYLPPSPSPSKTPRRRSPPSDPLSSLLYLITAHENPRRTTIYVPGTTSHRTRTLQAPQRQVLACLGSNTLRELAEELEFCNEGVPKELAPRADVEDREGRDEGEDSEPEQEGEIGLLGQRTDMSGKFGAGVGEKKVRATRWKDERRVTGRVFGIEGVLYGGEESIEVEGEDEQGVRDYAQMVLDLVDLTEWPARSNASHPSHATDTVSTANTAGQSSASPNPGEPSQTASPSANTPDPSKPQLKAGPSMADTRLGELEKLQTGKPYWFMTEGNSELIWTVDSIRHIHPLDPSSTAPSLHPYPITLHLSRPIPSSTSSLSSAHSSSSSAKCRICDKDPAYVVLVDDELVGESPAVVCEACFEWLHPLVEEGDEEEGEGEEGTMGEGRRYMKQGGRMVRVVPISMEEDV
ncbi:hypothetical protein JCM11641_002189 [Rhodosporidiobolus odoratus]